MFGEMSFLFGGCATASIIAEGSHVKIYVIERTSLYLLFIHYPHLAGKFYNYLANILAVRLSERELELRKSEDKGGRRRAVSKAEDESSANK